MRYNHTPNPQLVLGCLVGFVEEWARDVADAIAREQTSGCGHLLGVASNIGGLER